MFNIFFYSWSRKCQQLSIRNGNTNGLNNTINSKENICSRWSRGRSGRDRMIVWFTTTCAISVYHHLTCEFESRSWRGVLDTALCDKVCQWLATGRWISPGTPVSSTNKTHRHHITEVLLKVALNTTTPLDGAGLVYYDRQWLLLLCPSRQTH